VLIIAIVVVGGGLYLYSDGDADLSPPADPRTVVMPVQTSPASPASVVPVVEVQQLAPPPPMAEQAEPRPAPPSASSRATTAKPRVAMAQKPRKPASAAPVVAPPVAVVATPPPAPAVPPPVEPPNPQTACTGLNFFARARCMVTQCAKADFKASPQCEAVHRQQQIDEEKRNPTMAG
jgi:hypothetical protein